MSLAPQELENTASKYASQAIKFDSQGARGMAISNYQQAIDALVKLLQLYPNSKLNQIYKDRCNSYHNRICSLQQSRGVEPAVDPEASDSDQKASVKRQEDENDFEELVMKVKPDVTWDQVIGLDEAKSALRESIVYPTKRPDLFPLGWPKGMLLYGPPGTGKTMLAAATANEMDGYFINVDASSLMSKWLGEAEKNVAKLFAMARKYAEKEGKAVILFVDEVDSLLGARSSEVGGEVRTKNQFLTEMDGVNGKGKQLMLYVIGATNKPWSLDAPFLRRFQKRIYVNLPTQDARENLFDQYTAKLNKNSTVSSAQLAKLFDGYSASDIKDVCQAAQIKTVHEIFDAPDYHEPIEGEARIQPRSLTADDFKNIMSRRKPSVSLEMIRAYHKWSEEFQAL
ncbi:MAG: AAA family ATPase [Candidatus Nitrosopumilus limneticus]|nr:Cell division protein C [Candidatus Nitrosopumilus limneticus]MDC4212378.1 AAA family ATPase [Candidatus Nitrosopumilus limneticus]MDC4213161.1 AAA family ATPase [Candidatus Nitrosopumilus limneticus]MDC4215162.1 AAA family ATPase [Candidatus Nitrosopumilus limneticus]MDC4215371.1 AAA family ATPase [Candidatus Nitrosopumilus limneticus]